MLRSSFSFTQARAASDSSQKKQKKKREKKQKHTDTVAEEATSEPLHPLCVEFNKLLKKPDAALEDHEFLKYRS